MMLLDDESRVNKGMYIITYSEHSECWHTFHWSGLWHWRGQTLSEKVETALSFTVLWIVLSFECCIFL